MNLLQHGKSIKHRLESNKSSIDMFLFILIIIQPLLDVFSFFMVKNDLTILSTMIRMLMFGIVALYSFTISDNKKAYFITAGVLIAFFTLHMTGCFMEGYQSLFQDITMYFRTIQMPVFVLCFITLFKKGKNIPNVIAKGFVVNYLIITGVIALSYIMGMPEYTYQTGIGLKGWFAIGNAQSCIISLMAPLTIYWAINNKKKIYSFIIMAIAYANLFFFGTKVAYYFIFISLIGMLFFMIINKNKDKAMYFVIVLCIVVCAGGYKQSPCYANNYLMGVSFDEWNADIDAIREKHKNDTTEDGGVSEETYREIYNLYNKDMVDRFGLKKVVEKYNYSLNSYDLVDNRKYKVNHASLVMDEKNTMVRLFGFEYMDFVENGESYEPENDFPAIYFSNGIVGLCMYLAFILYFIVIILIKMKKGIKDALTIECGAVGITFVLLLGAAQLSGNVLRRPNVTIYFSLILAYVYYICKLKKPADKF